MSEPTNSIMENHHYVTLIVRLRLDRMGQPARGELIDATGTFQKGFTGTAGLTQALAAWLRQQEQAEAASDA